MAPVTQTVLTIVADVDPAKVAELKDTLKAMHGDPGGNPVLPLAELDTLHFASLVLAEGLGGERCKLIFEANVDGTGGTWIDTLVRQAPSGLDAIFRASPSYPGSGERGPLRAWLKARVVRPGAFHIGATGRDLARIRQEHRLHEAISGFLDEQDRSGALAGVTGHELRSRIQAFVRDEPALRWALAAPPPRETQMERFAARARAGVAAAGALALAPVLVPALLVAGVSLVIKERTDPVLDTPPDAAHVQALEDEEDLGVIDGAGGQQLVSQNHLSSVIPVKPGLTRATVLPLVLYVLNHVARIRYTNGKLGSIPSIHFAHWSLVDDRRHLLFVSNFDGSWESYLGEFIDKAAVGLTAVWSNTVNFPRTRLLIREGATDGPRFRQWARSSQCGTAVWYSAYPSLTMTLIDNNSSLREDLFGDLDDEATAAWLRRL